MVKYLTVLHSFFSALSLQPQRSCCCRFFRSAEWKWSVRDPSAVTIVREWVTKPEATGFQTFFWRMKTKKNCKTKSFHSRLKICQNLSDLINRSDRPKLCLCRRRWQSVAAQNPIPRETNRNKKQIFFETWQCLWKRKLSSREDEKKT